MSLAVSNSFRLIRQLAGRQNWLIESLDPFSDSLIRVTDRKGRSTLVGTGRYSAYPINSATAAGIARDKAHTAQLLKAAGIATPDTELVFLHKQRQKQRPSGRELENASEIASRLGYPLIVKPNDGANGVHVFRVAHQRSLHACLNVIAQSADSAVLQKPLSGREYRLFILDGEPLYAHEKCRSEVRLQEETDLKDVVLEEDKRRAEAGMPRLSSFEIDLLKSALSEQGLDCARPLPKGSLISFGLTSNLAQKGTVRGFRTKFTQGEKDLCQVLRRCTGLRVAGIDLMGNKEDLGHCAVLEVNANPGIKALSVFKRDDLAEDIFKRVIEESLAL